MALNVTHIINFEKICRLCLLEKHFLTEIFNSSANENCVSIDKKIVACASIELSKDDGLPKRICVKCLSSVNAAFDFRIQCENADKTLHHVKTIVDGETLADNKNLDVSKRINEVVLVKKAEIANSTGVDTGDVLFIIHNEKLGRKEDDEKNDNVSDQDCFSSDIFSSQSTTFIENKKCMLTISNETSYLCASHEIPQVLASGQEEEKEEINTAQIQLNEKIRPKGDTRKMPCPHCNKRLTRIDEHIRLLHRNRVYKCIKDGCGAEFLTLKNLQSHQLNCYKLKKGYKCTSCMKEFHRKSNFKAHIRRHGNKKDFQCQFCEKAFVDSTGLKRHFLKHHEPEQEVFISGCCGKRFKSKEGLRKHIQKSICGIKIFQVVSTEDE